MTIHYDREVFFNSVRDELFDGALTQQQVDGMGIILGLWEGGYTGTPMTTTAGSPTCSAPSTTSAPPPCGRSPSTGRRAT